MQLLRMIKALVSKVKNRGGQKQKNPTLKRTGMDKIRAGQPKKRYKVHYGVYHDGNLITRFELMITAKSRGHAWKILDQYVAIRPTAVTRAQ